MKRHKDEGEREEVWKREEEGKKEEGGNRGNNAREV